MPIIISLKEPSMNLMLAGDINDETEKEYDALFPNLMVKNLDGQNIVLPLSKDCNIAFIKEATMEEVKKIMADAKARREAGQAQGNTLISDPTVLFPRNQGGRRKQ